MAHQKYLVVVGGPTASGKTAFAIQLAKHFNTEIISCDSRQFYREMNIGTAKPSVEEMQGVTHHFLSQLSIFDSYNVGDFERDAIALLKILHQKYDIIIAVGGSGLYLKAVCEGLDTFPEVPENIRQEVRQLYAEQGLKYLQKELQVVDPEYYTIVDQQNPHRLIRALEVTRASGKPFSSFHKNRSKQRPFQSIGLQIDLPREALYDRINQRVDDMMQKGLLQEAETLLPNQHLVALQTVGYQELFNYFNKKITLEEAVDKIKQNSRNYAKRQLTWWRRDGSFHKFHPEALEAAIHHIQSIIK